MQRLAGQCQGESAVTVAEGADLPGVGDCCHPMGSHRAAQPGCCHPQGGAEGWRVSPMEDGQGQMSPIRRWCHPRGMSEVGIPQQSWCHPLGTARCCAPPQLPRVPPTRGAQGGSPTPPTPRHVGTRGDAHLVAAGAGAAGLAGGGAVRWVAPQEGAGGTGLAGTSAVVQGVPGGAGGTEPPSGGTAAAEGSHPPQHIGDIDGVELGHITGVTPALERSSASPSAGWNGGGGGVTLLSPSLCPHSPPRGSACAGRPR